MAGTKVTKSLKQELSDAKCHAESIATITVELEREFLEVKLLLIIFFFLEALEYALPLPTVIGLLQLSKMFRLLFCHISQCNVIHMIVFLGFLIVVVYFHSSYSVP